MRIFLLLVLVLTALPVSAQAIYRCVGKGGAVKFTSQPCNPLERTTEVVSDFVADDPAAARRLSSIKAEMNQRNAPVASYGQSSSGYTRRDQKRAQCSAARQHRDSVLRSVGIRRNFSLLRQLDEQVNRACAGL